MLQSTTNREIASDTTEDRRSKVSPAYLLFVLFAAQALNYADRHIFIILIEPIKTEFGMSDSVMGFLAGPAFILLFCGFSIPLARIADKWSRRNVLAFSVATWSFMTAICGLAMQFWLLVIGRIGVGIGEAGGLPASQSLVASHMPTTWRTTAMAILNSGGHFGVCLGMFGGALIATHFGWRTAFVALGVPGILLAMIAWKTLPDSRNRTGLVKHDTIQHVVMLCLRNKAFSLIAFGIGFGATGAFAMLVWAPSFFMRAHGLPIVDAGLLIAVNALAGGISGALISARIVDKFAGRIPQVQLLVPAMGFLLGIPSQAAIALWPTSDFFMVADMKVPVASTFIFVSAFFFQFWSGPAYVAIQNLVPSYAKTQASALFLVIYTAVGHGLGPPAAGLISDFFQDTAGAGSLRFALAAASVTGLIPVITLVAASVLYRRHILRKLEARSVALHQD